MNNEYMYFLYGTTIMNDEELAEIFAEGIVSQRVDDQLDNINSIMKPIAIPAGDISYRTKATSQDINGNAVFVIMIPKNYLEPIIINGKMIYVPLPIWKRIETSSKDKVSILPPELIYGVYLKTEDKFKPNPNCSPVFDPTGMQYDESQVKYFQDNGQVYWQMLAEDRRYRTFDELVKRDEKLHPWNYALEIYSGHFGGSFPKKKAV